MSCNCLKSFNYQISYKDCKTILFEDKSVWVEKPTQYTISILVSGFSTWKEVIVNTDGLNVITSQTLIGLNQNLPIGIYCLKTINCNGDEYNYDFLNLCTYECELANELSSLDLNDKDAISTFKDKKLYIDAINAKFNCDWCNKDDINSLLSIIKKNNNGNCKHC